MNAKFSLAEGVAQMGEVFPGEALEKLQDYLALLQKWNKVYNLTAIRNPEDMLTHHVLDSLSALPPMQALLPASARIADVGSGGGLPGVVLAIVRPDWQIVSIETVQKKASFQQQAQIELGLQNFQVQCSRVEQCTGQFDAIVSRAFAKLSDFVCWTEHLLKPHGHWFAMKGVYPEAEIADLPAHVGLAQSCVLKVPGLEAERHMIILESIHA